MMPFNLRLAVVVGFSTLGAAISAAPAFAACATAPAGAPVVNPGDLLGRFPAGGGGMVSEVRNMVATNPASVDGIAAIIGSATPEQKQAIGAGLGQAAGLCTRPEPFSAQRIQEAVLRLNNTDVTLAFQTVTGDRQTAATGGGGAGGGGGGGGGTGVPGSTTAGGSSSYVAPSTSSFANSGQTFSSGAGAFAGLTAGRNVTGTTTATSPASGTVGPVSTVSSPGTTSSQNQP